MHRVCIIEAFGMAACKSGLALITSEKEKEYLLGIELCLINGWMKYEICVLLLFLITLFLYDFGN